MKKFLSILLALAVGFTFTFGSAMSAFAAATSTETTTVNSYSDAVTVAYNEVKATIDANYNTYVSNLKGTYTISGITGVTDGEIVDATVLKAGADETKDKLYTELSQKRAAGYVDAATLATYYDKTTNTLVGSHTYAELKDVFVASFTDLTITDTKVVAISNKAFMKGLFDAAKADALAKLNLVDVSSYSDQVICKDDPYKTTHIAAATDIKAELIKTVNETVLTEADTDDATSYDAIAAKIADIQTAKGATKIAGDSKSLGTDGKYYKYLLVNPTFTCNGTAHALKTADQIKADDEKEGINKTADLSTVTSRAAAYKQAAYTAYTTSSDTNKKAIYEAAIAEADAYAEVWTEIINNGTYTSVAAFDYPVAANTYTGYVAAYNQAVKDATAYKQDVEIDGTVKYDATVIDKNLAKVKTKIYNQAAGVTYTYKSTDLIVGAAKTADLAWEKSVKLAALNNAEEETLYNAKGEDLYYEIEKAKVAALYDEVEAKINAATTVAQLKTVDTTVSTTGIKNKDAVNAYIASLATFDAEAAKVQTALDDINEAAGAKYSWNDNYIALDKAELAKFYAEKGARTGSEIKALLADAKTWAASQPTVAAIAANKTELEEKIKSLPAVITLADKAAVKEVADAVEAGLATPSNMATLTAAINAVKNAEEDAINKQIKALDYNKITVADKTAAKAIVDAIDAYENETLYDDHTNYSDARAAYFNAMRNADKAAVIAAIAALPENATAAQVEAVKAQYDEFVKEYTDAETNYNAADQITNYSRLEYAIKNAQWTADDAKAYVQDLAIAVRTAKSGKKVKVTVNADVQTLIDNGYTVEYKFYKSTKKGSGYKNTVNKTTNTYTNTNPVKGKNYYKVKLVVKNADGTVVATTPLTQCKYGVRTIK